MIEVYGKSTMLADRKAREAELAAWIAKDSSREAKYGKTLAELDALIAKSKAHQERDMILSYIGSTTMLTARSLYRLANEKLPDDMQREPGFQERDIRLASKRAWSRIDRRYAPSVDKAVLFDMLKRYAALPEDKRLPALDKAFGIDKSSTKLSTENLRQNVRQNWVRQKTCVWHGWINPLPILKP